MTDDTTTPQSPARTAPADGADAVASLSPSRAGDFLTCPLLYRFRHVDRLPEPPNRDAVRGSVVHKVLEELFDLPAGDRTPAAAGELIGPAWDRLQQEEPEAVELFDDVTSPDALAWWEQCRRAVDRYFTLEDPTRLEPAEREAYVETVLDSRLLVRGYIDRLDVAPDGRTRVVDYKSGRAPRPGSEQRALFQLRIYALVLWRSRGVVPAMLQLIYLGSGEVIRYEPDEADLRATERKLGAVWQAIRTATESGDWRPRPSGMCRWCAHQEHCPEFGGTPPPLPVEAPDQRINSPS